jgi:hypothetical protein
MTASLVKNSGSVVAPQSGTHGSQQGGSLLPAKGKISSAEPLPPIGRNELIREWQGVVLQFPIKQASFEQDVTTKAIQGQRNGDNAPEFLSVVNQARKNATVRAEVARMIGIPGHFSDPAFMEAWDGFMAFWARKQQIAEDGPAAACDEAMGDLFGQVRH